jgi:hypothetical protein
LMNPRRVYSLIIASEHAKWSFYRESSPCAITRCTFNELPLRPSWPQMPTSAFEPEGREFESLRAHHFFFRIRRFLKFEGFKTTPFYLGFTGGHFRHSKLRSRMANAIRCTRSDCSQCADV